MYLSTLRIKDFRRLRNAELKFQRGLNVIVGENNSGKTAIVDAILTVLNDRQSELDDVFKEGEKRSAGFSIEAFFDGMEVADEAAFVEALVPSETPGQYRARLSVNVTVKNQELYRTSEVGSGSKAGMYYEVLNARRVEYLPALRDPKSTTGLRAGRQSKIAGLLRRTSSEDEQKTLCGIAETANTDMKKSPAVGRVENIVQQNIRDMSGLAFLLETDLNFVMPDFDRLAGQLEGLADGLPAVMTGLGYGNLIYIATVLGDLARGKDTEKRYRALVIEEPEAHLHPQQQILLLRFLESQLANNSRNIQVFVTTHSPILASQVAMDCLLPLMDTIKRDADDQPVVITCTKPINVAANSENVARIAQYLDATRSELFFAKKLILVEGDSERMLLPALFKHWRKESLEKSGITVVSVAGLNFHWFVPFIKQGVLDIPVAILTDADRPKRVLDNEELSESAYVTKLKLLVDKEPNIEVYFGQKTFEYDLAAPSRNKEAILGAIERVRIKAGPRFRSESSDRVGAGFAAAFQEQFFADKSTSKTVFAVELALLLEGGIDFEVPEHIIDAFEHVLNAKAPTPKAGTGKANGTEVPG
ncbi:MAG: AAA family ATPase [Vulcanimicrobiaceae bacterium]|jgi:putative ATP-dependent endonuclease of OLD family